jgi:hypothetical protein
MTWTTYAKIFYRLFITGPESFRIATNDNGDFVAESIFVIKIVGE